MAAYQGGTWKRNGLNFSVEVDASSALKVFEGVDRALQGAELAPFLDHIAGPHFQDRISKRFQHAGDQASGKWPALSPATTKIKLALGVDYPFMPNRRSQRMEDFLTSSHVASASGPYEAELRFPEQPKDALMERKLRVAQEGDNANFMGLGSTPPRPVLAVDSLDLREMVGLLSRWIVANV